MLPSLQSNHLLNVANGLFAVNLFSFISWLSIYYCWRFAYKLNHNNDENVIPHIHSLSIVSCLEQIVFESSSKCDVRCTNPYQLSKALSWIGIFFVLLVSIYWEFDLIVSWLFKKKHWKWNIMWLVICLTVSLKFIIIILCLLWTMITLHAAFSLSLCVEVRVRRCDLFFLLYLLL